MTPVISEVGGGSSGFVGFVRWGSKVSPMAASICGGVRQWTEGRIETHSVQPHPINTVPILVLWQLNAPLSTVLVRGIFPRRDDALLEKIIIRLLWQLRRLDNVVIQSATHVLATEVGK